MRNWEKELENKINSDNKWWQKDNNQPIETNDVPLFLNTTDIKNSDYDRLHNELAQIVVDFCKKHNLSDAFSITFNMDNIQPSVEYGEWCPMTDGYMSIENEDGRIIVESI